MFKNASVLAALLVPALVVSVATAAPKKKKKTKNPTPAASSTVVAPAATTPTAPPTPPVLETKPGASALTRADTSSTTTSPKEAPTTTMTPPAKDAPAKPAPAKPAPATSTTTLTSAEVPAAGAPVVAASVDADVATPRATRQEPLGEGFSLAPVADYGTSKVYGFGIGGRAGYTLSSRIYLGGTFQYHTGGTNGPLRYGLYYFGPEVGYSAPVGPIVIRPYAGGGYGSLQTKYTGLATTPGDGGAGTNGSFTGRSATAFIWPGVTIFVPIGSSFALGADVRAIFAPGQDASTGTLANNGTLRFAGTSPSAPSSTALAAGLTASYRF